MDCSSRIRELRESTGMNRKEFCQYFQIPYRTVTEWERDNRHAPEYVLRLLEYYIRSENLGREEKCDHVCMNHTLTSASIETIAEMAKEKK